MNFTKDQLLTLMNTIDFATDNDASYEEYTILSDADLVDCRQALIDRTNRIMEALNEIGTEE